MNHQPTPLTKEINMAVANSSYSFEITSTEKGSPNRRSGLRTFVISGICTDKDGQTFNFVATNNLDMRYPERFKVNWNGKQARMPKVVGHGVSDSRLKLAHAVSSDLYFTRGARVAIARRCKELVPQWQMEA